MAIKLSDNPNTDPVDFDNPDGVLNNDEGEGNGTPVNVAVYNDTLQFMAKMMREAGIVYNGLPDAEYQGHQLFEAFQFFNGSTVTKIIEIGDWDMDADSIKAVAHGITDFTKIREVSAMIITDSEAALIPLNVADAAGVVQGGVNSVTAITATDINLTRLAAGVFDDTAFDDTPFNRGWVTVRYSIAED